MAKLSWVNQMCQRTGKPFAIAIAVWLASCAGFIGAANAATTRPSPAALLAAAEDKPQLKIGSFSVRYLRDHAGLPTTREILDNATFSLRPVEGGFAGLNEGEPGKVFHFNDPALHDAKFAYSSFKFMHDGVRAYLNSRGLIAVFVYAANSAAPDTHNGPDALLLDYDKLANNDNPIDVQLIVVVGIVSEIRAITSTDQGAGPLFHGTIGKAETQIKRNSPAKVGEPMYGTPLQDYLSLLNRRPGRHVDISLSSADPVNEDDVALDYLIHLSKPWSAYVGASNTGTSQTEQWQERFGFIDNELTGNDDIFTVDFNTSSFADNYSFSSQYDFPILNSQTVRGRAYGSFGKFNSSDLGLTGEFLNGDSSEIGLESSVNIWQHHQFFVDAVAGAKVDNYFVDVKVPPLSGKPSSADAAFLFPYIGLRASQSSDVSQTDAQIEVLFDSQNPSSPTKMVIGELGRLNVQRNYTILQANASESFFVEPLLSGWETRDRSARPVAANELFFSTNGQFTPGDKRLIPELEATAGGLYSVRGYPDSVVAGDSVIYGTAEYRLHLPRLLGVGVPNSLMGRDLPPPPLMGGTGGFNYQPRAADTPGDWDLIFRTFVDAGYVHYNKIKLEQAGTFDAGLVGTGCGLEMRLRDNVSVRADYGWPLTPVHEAVGTKNELDILPGQGRFNFVFTLLY